MSDFERREHERLAREGDPAARVRMLRDRIRDGTLSERSLELAAYCHLTDSPETAAELAAAAAWEALEPSRRPASEWKGPRAWVTPGLLERFGSIVAVRAALAARRRELGPQSLRSAERWLKEPTRESVRLDEGGSGLEMMVRNLLLAASGSAGPNLPMDFLDGLVAIAIARSTEESVRRAMVDALVSFALASPPSTFRLFGIDWTDERVLPFTAPRTRDGWEGVNAATGRLARVLTFDLPVVAAQARARFDPFSRIDHANVAKIRVVVEDEGHAAHAQVIAEAGGAPLPTWLERRPSLQEKLALVGQVAEGVECLNGRGIVHGWLRPESVWVEGSTARVWDHGYGALDAAKSPMHMAGFVRDGVEWLSPEGIMGEQATPVTDVYGLAAVAFYLLEGRPPFVLDESKSMMERMMTILQTPAPPRASTKGSVLSRGLAKDPKDRYPTVRGLRDALLA